MARPLTTLDKPLPVIPLSSILSLHLSTSSEFEELFRVTTPLFTAFSKSGTFDAIKRKYALLELLRSERTYASDLVLLRNYQIPLASGQLSSISSLWPAIESTISRYHGLGPAASNTNPAIPSGLSTFASRPSTTVSDISAVSLSSIFTLRPMKTKDVSLVFSSIGKLAAFSDKFLGQLESALGDPGNVGEDHVGKLFLESISQMEPLYTTYIMNHAHALEHYHHLSKTFQFDVYFPQSQILARKCSNAWDLPSLLIKPVQRLLHYPQLLAAILSQTPDSHSDKTSLVEAHARMEEMARGLNARWRQQKVVQEVLASGGAGLIDAPLVDCGAARKRRKSSLKVGLPTPVGRIMGLRSGAKEGPEVDPEAKAVKAMGEKLKRRTEVMTQFGDAAMHWAWAMGEFVVQLHGWAMDFERVISLDLDGARSNAFDAFQSLINDRWLPACIDLLVKIGNDVLPCVTSFMDTTAVPLRLLETMQTLEQLHYDLLGIPASKSRRPPHLIEASQSYLALRAQLLADLPKYLALLDKGMTLCIREVVRIQWRYYTKVRDLWVRLWHHVRFHREANVGAAGTLRIWQSRYQKVEARILGLTITRMPAPEKDRVNPGRSYVSNGGQAKRSRTSPAVFAPKPGRLEVPMPLHGPSDAPPGRPRPISSVSTSTPAIISHLRRKTRGGRQIFSPYKCRVIHPCTLPGGVEYQDLPFFKLVAGEVYEIIQIEAGHLLACRDLPLCVDNVEECLLLVRNGGGDVGWAFATFMEPMG